MKKFNLKSIALATTMALSVVLSGGVQALATSDPSLEQTSTSTTDNPVVLESLNNTLLALQVRNNALIISLMCVFSESSSEDPFGLLMYIGTFSNSFDGVASFLLRALNSNDIQYKRRVIQSTTLQIGAGEHLLPTLLSRSRSAQ